MTLPSERIEEAARVPVRGFDRPVGHTRVTGDGKFIGQGGIYHGGFLLADSNGAATARIIDGLDADGDVIDFLDTGAASNHDTRDFPRGVRLLYGLYVDLGSNVSQCNIYYDPPPADRI